MKISLKRIEFALIAFVFLALIVHFASGGFSTREEQCQETIDVYKNFRAYGKVIRKYIDKENHSNKIIDVENFNNRTIIRFYLLGEHSGLYDSLEIGHVVKKNYGELKVLYGKDSLSKVITMNLGCKGTE